MPFKRASSARPSMSFRCDRAKWRPSTRRRRSRSASASADVPAAASPPAAAGATGSERGCGGGGGTTVESGVAGGRGGGGALFLTAAFPLSVAAYDPGVGGGPLPGGGAFTGASGILPAALCGAAAVGASVPGPRGDTGGVSFSVPTLDMPSAEWVNFVPSLAMSRITASRPSVGLSRNPAFAWSWRSANSVFISDDGADGAVSSTAL